MKIVGFLMLLCISFTHSYFMDRDLQPINENTVTYKYDRIDEVKRECAFVLNSALELKPGYNRMNGIGIKKELSFINGDWWQEANGVSLMPFDGRDVPNNSSTRLNLVSFWVSDVDRSHRSEKSVSVSGVVQMGITLEDSFVQKPYEGSPRFDIWPGQSQLSVLLQGIYTESQDNGGERVLCLLGNAMLPSRDPGSTDQWEWVKGFGYANEPPLLQDDQILLVLRYPKTPTLTNRAIRGSMRSLNPKSNLKYFDEVQISSGLGTSAKYEFSSDKIVSKACSPYPYKDNLMKGGIDIYKGLYFCLILKRFTQGEAMIVVPNWRCNGNDDFCSKLGPFGSDKEIKATNGSFKDVKLVLQDVQCEKELSRNNGDFSRVSAVFRAVSPSEKQFHAAQRTGLNNMTLSADGVWNSSSGQLCMVGCLGIVDVQGNGCKSRICLYLPLLFSIKQRSIIMGTISSIDESARSYFPLSFEKLVRPAEMWDQYATANLSYSYSKIDSAGAVLEKNEPFNVGTVIKKSLLKFPKLEDTQAFLFSLSLLSEDLTLHSSAFPDPIPKSRSSRTNIQMEIISLGPLFWPLLVFRKRYNLGGRDSLPQDVRASWRILHDSMDLEDGLDCLVEVVVTYPPTTSRWLVSPTARISISSQRTEDDPLYFSPIKLKTFPLMYRKQREDILSRRGVEGILRILTLSLAIACILSQLFYIRENLDSVPYVSLVMLSVQALGYSLPLITGAEAIFKRMETPESYESPSYDLQKSQWLQVIDYTVKLLVLVSFSLTLRLCQKVWKSRVRLLTRAPLEPHRVPSEKRVLLVTSTIHVIGYVIVLVIHSMKTSQRPLHGERFVDSTRNSQTLREWETELVEYVGLIQDFFLLPQIIGNLIWQIHCKPLRKLYFIGITVVRLLPHIYDYMRSPIPNSYFSEEYEFVNPQFDFYSKFGDIAIPMTAILLAVIVYVQQKWSYEKLGRALTFGRHKLLPMGSKVYERLPSQSVEAELVTGVNGDAERKKEHGESDD
ncbi:PII, uridylyltransferase [Actinidia rufa]|uniref:RING-type E3 ubiquitin transferase n=1 Tax=Actinidia rufa TaxID=165716 RepID=A0A7J0FE75_9ERIC|nr:PII, uridylyltransferase [Actinidia rufa]